MEALKSTMEADSEPYAACHVHMRAAAGALLARAQEAGVVRDGLTGLELLRIAHAVAVATERSEESGEPLLTIMMDGLRPQS
ncbi:hypothetical protein [Sphaerisporangium sp. NPDC051011]|uniref:SbtR family transcriptional regulator n=1 Tax=Sphaerisporangium sp. NPDC051011 TaxID=3155792 RepID=UPI0033E61123